MKHIYKDLLAELKRKHGTKVHQKLISLRIVLSDEDFYLHSEYSDEPGSLFIEKLDFIADDDLIELSDVLDPVLFNPQLGVKENARRFIEELDEYSIKMCFNRILEE